MKVLEKNFDVTTDEGYRDAVEVIAEARKTLKKNPLFNGLFGFFGADTDKFLDDLYASVTAAHDKAVAKRAEEAAKRAADANKKESEKLDPEELKQIQEFVTEYLKEKLGDAESETAKNAGDALVEYTAYLLHKADND